jgi:hypothetical protein
MLAGIKKQHHAIKKEENLVNQTESELTAKLT